MATLSAGMSITVNWAKHTVEFGKIDARVDGLDLEQDIDAQLVCYDLAVKKVCDKLSRSLKERIAKKASAKQQGELVSSKEVLFDYDYDDLDVE